jgi:hypothetical protein
VPADGALLDARGSLATTAAASAPRAADGSAAAAALPTDGSPRRL